jgi:hypothetical protein
MILTFYYTVITCQTFFMVKYAVVPVCEILTFPGTFGTALEAEQTFKKATHGKLEQLSLKAFERKVSDLHTRYKQDLAKLADWNIGKPVRI